MGVIIKGLDGALETIGGILFLLISRQTLNRLVINLTRPELLEDPDDSVANALRHTFNHLSTDGKIFGSIYLLVHGVVKILLVVCLLRGKLWSFPTAIAMILLFIIYQTYRLSTHYSWTLLFLTILDVAIIFLIRHEYVNLKQRRGR
jgi:uncharacterized membrane protein